MGEDDKSAEAQPPLFENLPDPVMHEWNGMPEFVQEDLSPRRSLLVHFESDADVTAFAELVEQSIGPNLKSIWYPEAEITRYADKRYADGPEEDD